MAELRAAEELRERVGLLDQRARRLGGDLSVSAEALEELQVAVEELRVAEEEIQEQSNDLIASNARLTEERQRYRDLFDFAPDAYLTTDGSGIIREANVAAGRMLRVPPEVLEGKPLAVYVASSERQRFRNELARLSMDQPEGRFRLRIMPRNGADTWVDARVAASASDDGGTCLRWILHDSADPQVLEGITRAMTETHHRVKNSLQLLAAMLDIRLQDDDKPYKREDLERLSAAIQTLAAMHDLLMHGAQSGGDGSAFSAQALINKMLPLLSRLAGDQAVGSQVADIPLTARQSTAVALILNELVSSAFKHGSSEVKIQLNAGEDAAELTVTDNGEGFPNGLQLCHSLKHGSRAGQ